MDLSHGSASRSARESDGGSPAVSGTISPKPPPCRLADARDGLHAFVLPSPCSRSHGRLGHWSLFLTKVCPFAQTRHCRRTRRDAAPQHPHGMVDSNPSPDLANDAFCTSLSPGFLPISCLPLAARRPVPQFLADVVSFPMSCTGPGLKRRSNRAPGGSRDRQEHVCCLSWYGHSEPKPVMQEEQHMATHSKTRRAVRRLRRLTRRRREATLRKARQSSTEDRLPARPAD